MPEDGGETKGGTSRHGILEGLARGLCDFVKSLEKMENLEERRSGEISGPFDSRAKYRYSVKLGICDENLRRHSKRGLHLRGGPLVHSPIGRPDKTRKPKMIREEDLASREPLVDVLDRGDHIAVVVQLPEVEHEDLHLEIVDGVLKIIADTGRGRIERDLSVPAKDDVERILGASFKNQILEVRLSKKVRDEAGGTLYRNRGGS